MADTELEWICRCNIFRFPSFPPSLSLLSWSVNLAQSEPLVSLVMDQSLQQGLATQTQSIEEELSSPVAICVMMRRRCYHINLGPCGLLQYVCMCAYIMFADQCTLHSMHGMCCRIGVGAGQVTMFSWPFVLSADSQGECLKLILLQCFSFLLSFSISLVCFPCNWES